MRKRQAAPEAESREQVRIQEFLDMISPSVIKFETDHFICGNTFRCVWALREYPTSTDEQAILSHLGEKDVSAMYAAAADGVDIFARERILGNAEITTNTPADDWRFHGYYNG